MPLIERIALQAKRKASGILSASRGGLASLFADSRHAGIPFVVSRSSHRTDNTEHAIAPCRYRPNPSFSATLVQNQNRKIM